jgi:hypothetical protein
MPRQMARWLPGPLRAAILGLSAALSRAFVRPEADRLLRLLSEPIIESTAYTNRALRDLESRLGAGSTDDLLALYVFRALDGLAAGAPVLAAGPTPPLLERGLAAAGYAVTRVDHAGYDALQDASFDALLLLDGRDPEPARRLARPGAVLCLTGSSAASLKGWGRVRKVALEGGALLIGRAR